MVDRSEPLVVTPQACPFVALDSDRDQRLTAPDARHRCFAEAAPKTRSMGHQASFCLTPAFTGCPIFLDWASRVAADVLPGRAPAGAIGITDGVSPSTSATTPTATVATAPAGAVAPASSVAAASVSGGAGTGAAGAAAGAAGAAGVAPVAGPAGVAPVAGALASPTPDAHPTGAAPAWAAAPPWIAEAATPPPDIFDKPTKRTARLEIEPGAAAAADAAVDARPSAVALQTSPLAPAASDAVAVPAATPSPADAAETDAELAASVARTDLLAGGYGDGSSAISAGADVVGDTSASAESDESGAPPWSRGRPRVPMDAGAPASLGPQTRPGARASGPREWEGARRFEAYAAGAGSGRLGRPALIAIGTALVAVALLVVFLLPSLFLSGGAAPTASPALSNVPAVAATGRPRPTPTAPGATPGKPDATPQSYRVKRGDTLLRIGRRFNVTVEQLVCANDIRNPNSLSVGTTLTIPIETYQCPKPTKKPK